MFMCFSKPKLFNSDYGTQYLAALIVSFGVLVEGMHYGWSSSAVPKLLEPPYSLSKEQTTYITRMFTYGSIAYDILSFAEYPRLSQKIGVITSVLIMTISWILLGLGKSAIVFMIARFFAGAGRGLVYQVSINYICEIANPEIRGFLGSLIFIMTNIGMLLIYCFGPYLNIFYTSLLGVAISLSELIAIKWIPESPYTLLLRGKTHQARSVFRSLRNVWNVEPELDQVTEVVRKQDEENSCFWSIFTVESNRKALLIIVVLNALQGLVGINVSIHQILKLSGGNVESYRVAVVSSMISVASCTLTALFVDCVGRKVILIISFSVCGLSFLLLGIYSLPAPSSPKPSPLLPLAVLLLYTMVYRMGVGLIPLLLSGELFPVNVKGTASSLTGLLSVASSTASLWLLDLVRHGAGVHVMYWTCGVQAALGVVFTWWCVPETRGATLDEVQGKLKTGGKGFLCGLSFLLLGIYSLPAPSSPKPSPLLPLAVLLLYTMVYRMGVGLIPLLLSGELFPVNVKGTASSLTGLLSVASSTASLWLLDLVRHGAGVHVMYWTCGVQAALGVVFTWWCVPETRGATLDEVQAKLKTGGKGFCK